MRCNCAGEVNCFNISHLSPLVVFLFLCSAVVKQETEEEMRSRVAPRQQIGLSREIPVEFDKNIIMRKKFDGGMTYYKTGRQPALENVHHVSALTF